MHPFIAMSDVARRSQKRLIGFFSLCLNLHVLVSYFFTLTRLLTRSIYILHQLDSEECAVRAFTGPHWRAHRVFTRLPSIFLLLRQRRAARDQQRANTFITGPHRRPRRGFVHLPSVLLLLRQRRAASRRRNRPEHHDQERANMLINRATAKFSTLQKLIA
jgi:hypothetical protein